MWPSSLVKALLARFPGYDEPVHHGIGRSRGGLSSKIHQLVDARGRPLVVLIGPGQANDSRCSPFCSLFLG